MRHTAFNKGPCVWWTSNLLGCSWKGSKYPAQCHNAHCQTNLCLWGPGPTVWIKLSAPDPKELGFGLRYMKWIQNLVGCKARPLAVTSVHNHMRTCNNHKHPQTLYCRIWRAETQMCWSNGLRHHLNWKRSSFSSRVACSHKKLERCRIAQTTNWSFMADQTQRWTKYAHQTQRWFTSSRWWKLPGQLIFQHSRPCLKDGLLIHVWLSN